jgi:hypothetical protein
VPLHQGLERRSLEELCKIASYVRKKRSSFREVLSFFGTFLLVMNDQINDQINDQRVGKERKYGHLKIGQSRRKSEGATVYQQHKSTRTRKRSYVG